MREEVLCMFAIEDAGGLGDQRLRIDATYPQCASPLHRSTGRALPVYLTPAGRL